MDIYLSYNNGNARSISSVVKCIMQSSSHRKKNNMNKKYNLYTAEISNNRYHGKSKQSVSRIMLTYS